MLHSGERFTAIYWWDNAIFSKSFQIGLMVEEVKGFEVLLEAVKICNFLKNALCWYPLWRLMERYGYE